MGKGSLAAFAVSSVVLLSYACGSEDVATEATTGADGGATDGTAPRPDGSSGGAPDAEVGQDAAGTDAGDASTKPDASALVCPAGKGDCDLDPANGCETTLAGNAQHCGACGRDCAAAGATCQTNKCSAVEIYKNQPIGTDNGNARTFAFGNGAVYHATYNGYAVRKMPIDGSGAAVVWSTTGKSAGIESLVVTATDVMWSERGAPAVMLAKPFTAAAEDLPKIAFTPEYEPGFTRLAGGKLFWASGNYQSGNPAGYIYSRDVAAASTDPGTKIVTVDQGNHGAIVALEASSDALYWIASSAPTGFVAYDIRTAPLAGGTPTAIPGGAVTAYPYNDRVFLQAVGKTVYFNRNAGTSALNGIYRYTPGDAAPTQLVMGNAITSFLVAGNDLYYAANTGVAGIMRAPVTGGQATEITGSGGGGGTTIVGADAKFVYFVAASCCQATLFKGVR